MLSHSVLAREQGYASIPPIYGQFNDPWLKKDDPHIKFLTDQLEPACAAFEAQRYGDMFECFGTGMPRIRRHLDKVAWADAMASLIALRLSGSVGEVLDFIAVQSHMRHPDVVEEREHKLVETGHETLEGESRRGELRRKQRAYRSGGVLEH